MKIRNQNDILTDAAAIGPTSPLHVIKSHTAYNEPGLPKPPGGWGRKLGLGEEAMEDEYPDLNDSD